MWYAKYRLPDGRQVQADRSGVVPAWPARAGLLTKRTAAAWLDEILRDAEVAGFARGEVRFDDAAREWLRYAAEDRACKPTTIRDYRNTVERRLMPFCGGMRLEDITPQLIETWRASLTSGARTKNKQLTILNGIMRRACRLYGLRTNPVSGVERLREPTTPSPGAVLTA